MMLLRKSSLQVVPSHEAASACPVAGRPTKSSVLRKKKSKLSLSRVTVDWLSKVAVGVAVVLVATVAVVEISTADLQTRVEDRLTRNLVWRLGKLNADFRTLSTSCDDATAVLRDKFQVFSSEYTHAKHAMPALKERTAEFRDFKEAFFAASVYVNATACSSTVSSEYQRALSAYRKSIGNVALKQRKIAVVFDALVSVLALTSSVAFVLLAKRRRFRGPSRADTANKTKSKAGLHDADEEGGAAAHNDDGDGADRPIHAISTPAVIADKAMLITDVNEAACSFFGYEECDELVGKNVKTLMPAEYAEKHDGYVEYYLKTGQSSALGKTRTIVARLADGSPIDATMKLLQSGTDANPVFTAFFNKADDNEEKNDAFENVTSVYAALEKLADGKRALAENLSAQEDMLRYLSVPVIVADESMTILDTNEATSRIFGYEHYQLKGMNVKDLMFPETAAKHDGYIKRHLETGVNRIIGSSVGRKVDAKHSDGSRLQLVLNVGKTKTADGGTKFTAIIQDITGLMKKMEEIAAEREKTNAIVDSHKDFLHDLAVGVICADHNMLIRDVNQAALRIFGFNEDDIIGQNVKTLIPPGDLRDRHDDIVAKYLETGVGKIVGSFEGRQVVAKAADGSDLHIVLNVSKSMTHDDPPRVQFTAVFQDVTAMTKQMLELEKQKKETLAILANQKKFLHDLAVGVVVADKQCRIIDVNQAMAAIFGYEVDQLIGQNVNIFIPHGDLKDRHDDIVANHLATGEAKIIGSYEGRRVVGRHSNGNDIHLIINVSKAISSTGEPTFTAVFQDISKFVNDTTQPPPSS